MTSARLLTLDDVDALRRGTALLGSGGGQRPYISALYLEATLAEGRQVRLIGMDQLSDGWVLMVGMAGNDADEKLPAKDQLRRCFNAAAAHMGIDIDAVDAIGVTHLGGTNGVYPFITAAQLGKPVVDADVAGRAFRSLEQNVLGPALFGPFVFVDAHGTGCIIDEADAETASRAMRGVLAGFGGSAAGAFPPLRVETFRRVALPGTVSYAIGLGGRLREGIAAGDDGEALAARLGGRGLGRGRVLEISRSAGRPAGHSSVGLRSSDGQGVLRVEMASEYVLVLRDGEVVATTPDVICLLDVHSRQTLYTDQVRRGHEVDIMVLPTSDRLWSPDLLARVGPRAYDLDVDPVRNQTPDT